MNCDKEQHRLHMCSLKEHGRDDLVRSLSTNPTVECRFCGARADSLQNICAAHLGDKAPNVEGGHGSVGLDEVGKPHAGKK